MNRVLLCIAALCLIACGDNGVTGPGSWECNVTLTLVPSRINDLSSPSGSGSGTGQGGNQNEALRAALKQACAGLGLDASTRAQCESGGDFQVEVTSGGITLISGVERSQQCRGSS